MDDREGYEAQQEAKRETLGKTSESTRERVWEGLTKYLAAEAEHARAAAASEKKEAKGKSPPDEEDQERRSL
ncbi:MAG TPA: hypothetical protein VLB29_00085 [Nocardioidaceae bacterium]|nr:hypothetical protein [Nocardioidaceae bacterium]